MAEQGNRHGTSTESQLHAATNAQGNTGISNSMGASSGTFHQPAGYNGLKFAHDTDGSKNRRNNIATGTDHHGGGTEEREAHLSRQWPSTATSAATPEGSSHHQPQGGDATL